MWATLVVLVGCAVLAGCSLFPQPPVAAFVVRYGVDPVDPLVIELDATGSSDPNDDIATYLWTFGDDVTILTPLDFTKAVGVPVIQIRYPFQGTFSVQLLVRDDTGRVSQPVFATVTVPPAP
jgi:hypothetical protein